MFGAHRHGYATLGLLTLVSVLLAVIMSAGNLRMDARWPLFLVFWVGPLVLWFLGLALRNVRRRRTPLLRFVARTTSRYRFWIQRSMLLVAMTLLTTSTINTTKASIPLIRDFYADRWLIDLDRLIFRADPWVYTHALIGPEGTVLIDRLYWAWFFVLLGVLSAVCFTANARLQVRALVSYMGSWLVMGNLVALGLASVGPCFVDRFYGIKDFAPLMNLLQETPQPLIALGAMDWLLSTQGTGAFGAGISAMPSMHCAVAMWFVLVAFEGRWALWLRLAMLAYLPVILVGSVHLGWHYAMDGIVGAVAMLVAWWIAGRIADLATAPAPAALPCSTGPAPLIAEAR